MFKNVGSLGTRVSEQAPEVLQVQCCGDHEMKATANGIALSASDLVGHLNCEHLTALDVKVARGALQTHNS